MNGYELLVNSDGSVAVYSKQPGRRPCIEELTKEQFQEVLRDAGQDNSA